MGTDSLIEWTQDTWNPVTGCTKISQGCAHCYAERLAKRLRAMGNPRYKNGFNLTLHYDLVGLPLRQKRPRMIFVNSMSDLFHEQIPIEFISQVFDTMAAAPWHTFQVLTKRSDRLAAIADRLNWSPNIWIGATVENQECASRADNLRKIPAKIRFLSCEPLLEPVELNLKGIHWVIVGGESGPNARPMAESWVLSIKDQCLTSGIPFFFKQWGGTFNKKGHNQALLNGKLYKEWPIQSFEGKMNSVSDDQPVPLFLP